MSTLAEIEAAVQRLDPAERQQLLVSLARSLRAEGRPLPPLRQFSPAEMQSWIDEDERGLRRILDEA